MLNHSTVKKVHCIGVGGIGVSALAEWLLAQGYEVSGSDARSSVLIERLQHQGLVFFEGHDSPHVAGADMVVYSSAINSDNPELVAAQRLHLPLMKRGALLAQIADAHDSIAISGTHGKTTTTSLMTHCLRQAGVDPSSVVGGVINGDASPFTLGDGPYWVLEADESDASFLYLHPQVAVVTNIEHDHVETYADDFDRMRSSFLQFVNQVQRGGVAILCADDPHVMSMLPQVQPRVITYGARADVDVRGVDFIQKGLKSFFTVRVAEKDYSVELQLTGQHNMLNALAVFSLFYALDLPMEAVIKGCRDFPGVGRRFQYQENIVMGDRSFHVVEDYGHHPTEVRVTLESVRAAWSGRRVFMVFQPHRASRTAFFMKEFAEVLSQVDQLLLLDIYAVGCEEDEVVRSDCLKQQVAQCNPSLSVDVVSNEALFGVLGKQLREGDVLLFQGAGSVGAIAKTFLSSM